MKKDHPIASLKICSRIKIMSVAAIAIAVAAATPNLGAHEFGTRTWNFSYDGGAGPDFGDGIRFDSQGKLVVAGWITTASRAQDALVFQITPQPGSTEVNWDHTRDVTATAKNDRFYGLAIDSMDNSICVGVGTKPSNPYSQVLTEKFSPDGTSLWQDIWVNPGGTEAFANDVAINSEDEAFAATYFDISRHNYINWGVLKYSADGITSLEPDYTYDRGSATGSYSYSNRINGIALDQSGGLCTVGRIGEGSLARRTWHVRRYEENGSGETDLAWSHTQPAPASGLHGWAIRVAIDRAGNPVVAGSIMQSAGIWTGRIVKYDNETGLPDWTVERPSPKSSLFTSVFIDRMGYIWAAGYTTDAEDMLTGLLVRLDPADGTILNDYTWDGINPRAFDIRDRRLAVCLSDADNILIEAFTPDLPEITLTDADSTLELEVHSAYAELGYSAYDAFEREDLTSSVTVSDLPDTHTVGTYHVRYNVDAYNGESAVERIRTVRIVDTTAPQITLNGAAEIRVDAGVPYHEPGFVVSDNYDADLTESVLVGGSVDTSTPGIYQLHYSVSDSNGNSAMLVSRTVHVVQLVIKTVELTDSGEIRITCLTERGASYRILASPDMQDPQWDELAVVDTPEGFLDWSTPASGEQIYLKVQRLSE